MSITTKVNLAKPGSRSLKTTIPWPIAAYMQLSNGDELVWEMSELRRTAVMVKIAKRRSSKR